MVRPELDDTHAAAPSDPARTATAPASAAQPASPGLELACGLRLDHFRIEKKLGAGGMGEVYLATDLALDRSVAIKVLPAGVGSGDARERLVREARAQARINHPNVAHIHFIGEDSGRLYFAMEYVTGETLAERLAQGPLPVEDALAVVRSAALGLREAHRSGFTHRDVKPSNLMIDGNGVLKVLDFGLVTAAPDGVSDGPVAQTTLAGTPLYMAPEQARGAPVDLRSDIYALGATLFHLVSGQPPFRADSIDELLTMHAGAARPSLPRGANPRTQVAAIDMLIARMMAPRPEDRFASYDDLLRAIEMTSVAHTRPAGFVVRAIATALDLLIATLIVSLVQVVATGSDSGERVILRYALPVAVVYVSLALARWGTTLGKALFELEVVAIDTSERPRLRQALLRELAIAALPLLGTWGQLVSDAAGAPVVLSAVFASLAVTSIPLLALALLAGRFRAASKRALWDRAARTMVRYRRARSSSPLP